jgi:hypothetical protein
LEEPGLYKNALRKRKNKQTIVEITGPLDADNAKKNKPKPATIKGKLVDKKFIFWTSNNF